MAMANKVNDFLNWIVTIVALLGTVKDKTPEGVKSLVSHFMGLGVNDEAIFAGIIGKMTDAKRAGVSKLLGMFKDYQRRWFIYLISKMEEEEIKEETTTPTGKKDKNGDDIVKKTTKTTKRSKAVPFLEFLADLVEKPDVVGEDGAMVNPAVHYCLNSRAILADPMYGMLLKPFRSGVHWFEVVILGAAGVTTAEELMAKFEAQLLPQVTDIVSNGVRGAQARWQQTLGVGAARKGFWQRVWEIIW